MWPDWLYRFGDHRDDWTGIDKVAHFFGAGWCYAVTLFWTTYPAWATLTAIAAVEVVEAFRWQGLSMNDRAAIETGTKRWPVLTDRASLKDVGYGLAGLVVTRALIQWAA
jgi:hypothetical protein